MSKQKDASTCDERRVKNTPNPLTHKRKGETRTMYNPKHWKLGAFLVISLMLMAGLFANTASAQSAKVTVTPRAATFTAESVIPKLTLTYRIIDKTDLTEDNTVVLGLPTGWLPAYPEASPTFATEATGAVVGAPATTTMASYTTFSSRLASGLEATAALSSATGAAIVTVTVARASGNTTALPQNGNTITVNFFNVKVPAFTGTRVSRFADIADDDTTDHDEAAVNIATFDAASISDSSTDTDDPLADPTITVKRLPLGTVTVKPTSANAGDPTNLEIKYKFTEAMPFGTIEIRLPAGWGKMLRPRVFDSKPTSAMNTDDLTATNNTGDNTRTAGYVYLGRRPSRLMDTTILKGSAVPITLDAEGETFEDSADAYDAYTLVDVTGVDDGAMGWIIPIAVEGAVKGDEIVLHYMNAPAQRSVATGTMAAVIEVFSGRATAEVATPADIADIGYPATAHPKITVNSAKPGSGEVTVQFKGGENPSYVDFGTEANTEMSIPAMTVDR